MAIAPIFKKAYWTLAGAGAFYVLCLFALTTEWLQRHALYAHKVHTAWWQDLNQPEQFGFASNQVTPFNIPTPDGESLYAWHILPLSLYAGNERELRQEPSGFREDFTHSTAFRLLVDDPSSRLIINFHGNAGTVGQGWRTDTYRSLSSAVPDNIHVLTVDYRGFGYSTGSPTEQGIITDAVAVVDWALNVAKIPPQRVVLLGQSLGTAVTVAVAEYFAKENPRVEFAGVVLVAAFSDIPTLLLTYSIAGYFPILSPLRPYPAIQRWFTSHVRDIWNTSGRLERFVKASRRFHLHLIHAKSDFEIPWQHSESLFYTAANATSLEGLSISQIVMAKATVDLGEGGERSYWSSEGKGSITLELVHHGGHNRIVTYAPVALAVRNAFGI